jgi:hypothetical protein
VGVRRPSPLKLAAAVIAFASLAVPWFEAEGARVRVTDVPPFFVAPFYAGLAAACVAAVKGERFASLAAASMLASSPAYAYFALKVLSTNPSPAPGALLCLLSSAAFAADWLTGLRGGEPSEGEAGELAP